MSRSMYCKSLDERLLEIAGIGFLNILNASKNATFTTYNLTYSRFNAILSF